MVRCRIVKDGTNMFAAIVQVGCSKSAAAFAV